MQDPVDAAKIAAARSAVARLAPGPVALGTGSTAAWAVKAIAERFPHGRGFEFVCSSRATEDLARSLGLPVRALRKDDRFTVMIDGADEVSDALDLTKGGGGALLREKLLAVLSEELIIMVDPSKLVPRLGEKAPIPVEVIPFARAVLAERFRQEGYGVQLRTLREGAPFLTDNGNEVLDLHPSRPLEDPRATATALRAPVGVVETGLFPGMAHRVVIGYPDGRVEERLASAAVRRR
ncbi:MAG: ribose-5-phosphate isomerase RpiA [Thermoplasmata archaeon]